MISLTRTFRGPLIQILVVFLGASVMPSRAAAGNLDEFGIGARASALGGAFTAYASGPEAAYYNPGGLILSRHFNVQAGFQFVDYQLEFDSERGLLDDQAERIDDLSALILGFSTTVPFLGEPDRFGIGLTIFLPTRNIGTIKARAPTAEPEFAQYGDRQDRLQAYLAGALKITDYLFAGVGAQIFADADGSTDVDTVSGIGPSEFDLDIAGDVAPVVGVYFWPLENLSFGATFRGEISLKLKFDVTAFGAIPAAQLEAITLFSPDQFALGVAWNPTDTLFFLLDVTYFNWSGFSDPFLTSNGNRERLQFDDIVVPRFGIEYFVIEDFALRFGYFYRPSPIPEQDGRRNLIDSNKHVITAGVGYTFTLEEYFKRPAKEGEAEGEVDENAPEPVTTTINLFFQLHVQESESVSKNGPLDINDPVGSSFKTSGTITNFGADVIFRF